MNQSNCNWTRKQIDELELREESNSQVKAHLSVCADCRRFHQQQMKLRELVASLGTVEAPADFDFKLRARLVNQPEPSKVNSQWSWKVAYTAATVLVLLLGSGLVVRYVRNPPLTQQQAVANPTLPPAQVALAPVTPQEEKRTSSGSDGLQVKAAVRAQTSPPRKIKQPLVAAEFSSSRAKVFGQQSPKPGSVWAFPIDASLQSMKVSLDDDRGNARTISFPGVSFGSQRVLTTGNQIAPKTIW